MHQARDDRRIDDALAVVHPMDRVDKNFYRTHALLEQVADSFRNLPDHAQRVLGFQVV